VKCLGPAPIQANRMDKTLHGNGTKKPDARQWRVSAHQNAFIVALATTGLITEAARAVGISREQHYEWSRKDLDNRRRADDARLEYFETLLTECDRRAVEGVPVPFVNAKGEVIGHRIKYSDRLLMFRLRMLDPKYREDFKAKPTIAANRRTILDSPAVRELRRQMETLLKA